MKTLEEHNYIKFCPYIEGTFIYRMHLSLNRMPKIMTVEEILDKNKK